MHSKERAAVISLAAIMAFRMLGLFMLLPVFALYVHKIPGATPALIGLALGIYGLTQAFLQAPFGMISDHIGRKPIMTAGLVFFALGSLVAALSHSIYGIIIGRALQGAGAIGSTTLAMVADLTRDEERSKAMAMIGMAIGFSFSIALIIGPAINAWFQLEGIFWTTMILAILGILLLHTVVPTPPKTLSHPEASEDGYFKAVIKNSQLLRLDFGIFALHAILTALFIAVPLLLSHRVNLSEYEQALLYLIVVILAFLTILPFIIVAEKKRLIKPFFIVAIGLLAICSLLLLLLKTTIIGIAVVLFLFFAGFTFLEASLPSWVSKVSPIRQKGTAMGIYSSSQFLGIFVGGSVGGWIFGYYPAGIFIFCALLALLWFFMAIPMAHPPYLSTVVIGIKANKQIAQNIDDLNRRLLQLSGVAEVAVLRHDHLIYLKIDKQIISEDELRKQIREGNLV